MIHILITKKKLSQLKKLGQVDLWTRKSTGCSCNWGSQNNNRHKIYETNESTVIKETEEIRHNHTRRHQNCACCVTGECSNLELIDNINDI